MEDRRKQQNQRLAERGDDSGCAGEVGAARSIVIDETNTVLAGNATIEADGEAGITKLKIVDAEGDTIIAVRTC